MRLIKLHLFTGVVYVDSDTGLESMSSAEAATRENMGAPRTDADQLRQEVCRLKNDKLDLLKQNIVSNSLLSVVDTHINQNSFLF